MIQQFRESRKNKEGEGEKKDSKDGKKDVYESILDHASRDSKKTSDYSQVVFCYGEAVGKDIGIFKENLVFFFQK